VEKITPFNAGLKGGKVLPDEGGHTRAVVLDVEGIDIPASPLQPNGRSLVPLFENPKADWPDRTLITHVGRWNPGQREKSKNSRCAVRTCHWRLVNNIEPYDIPADRGQTKDVAAEHPEVVTNLRKQCDAWWKTLPSFLVNEELPDIKPGEFTIQKLRKTQGELPLWEPVTDHSS
jgi:arylsulfatase